MRRLNSASLPFELDRVTTISENVLWRQDLQLYRLVNITLDRVQRN